MGLRKAADRLPKVFLQLRLGHRTQTKLRHISTIADRLRVDKLRNDP
jgi:hypothetical protein